MKITMRVGFIYNMATEELLRERPEMTLRDSDTIETIDEVTRALEAGGHKVTGLNADRHLPAKLAEMQFDMVFNIATGVYGETRQAHVPAMLDYMRIPHTGPGVLGETICHHKYMQKYVFAALGLPVAPYQLFQSADEPLKADLTFPLICKLPSEGASMGLDYNSVVHDETALRERLAFLFETYGGLVIVEKYLAGREFTVGVLGNDPPYALPVAELEFFGQLPIRLDELEESNFELLKQATGRELELVRMESVSRVPANLPAELDEQVQKLAIAAFQAAGCKDWARVDLRMDEHDKLHVLEVNLGPGIASDCVFARMAFAKGWTFAEMVNTILNHAVERYRAAGDERINTYLGSLAMERERA
ncbi:MAG: hypothetical protein R3E39_11880 [Anaerolineae bacterium]